MRRMKNVAIVLTPEKPRAVNEPDGRDLDHWRRAEQEISSAVWVG
jgi:hypothetical protein